MRPLCKSEPVKQRRARAGAGHKLVGREAELADLQAMWHDEGAVAVVQGPAGIGKSRLVRELAAWASSRGAVALVGRCSSTSTATPLRPVREVLLGAARAGIQPPDSLRPFVPTLARLVPEWSPGAAAGADPSPLVLAEAVLRLLAGLGQQGTPALLVVEDVQWADAESASVIEYLADNIDGAPIALVVTLRTSDAHASSTVGELLVSRRSAASITLGPLADADVSELVRSIAGTDVPPEVEAVVKERSEGVPFLIEELLAVADGGEGADAVPPSVASSVERRLDDLPTGGVALLHRAAVLGRHFDWTLAARAAGLDEPEAAELLREAVRAQLVDVDGSGFRFHHGLTREAVLAAAGPAAARVAASEVLSALEASGGAVDGAGYELAASLATLAGDGDRAANFHLDAADRAIADGALAAAEALANRVRRTKPGAHGRRADMTLLRIHALSGRSDEAETVGRPLLRSSTAPEDGAEVHLLLARAALAGGQWSAAERDAAAARDLLPDDQRCAARSASVSALAAMARDDDENALRLARLALDHGRATEQPDVQCEALEVIGRAQRGRDVRAAEAAFSEALQVATDSGLPIWRVRALQELGTVDLFESLALDRLLEARRAAEEIGALSLAAVVDLQLAATYDERGDPVEALTAARRCEAASRRWGLSTLAMSLTIQAMAHARLGDEAAMRAAGEAARATGQDRAAVEIGLWGNAFAMWHIAAGDLPSAAAAFERGLDELTAVPGAAYPFAGLAALVHTLLDNGSGAGAAARARVRDLAVDTPVSRAMLLAAEAVAAGRTVRGRPADTFTEADTALGAFEGGFRQALVRLLVAPAAQADGWGDPVTWLRGALAMFEGAGLTVFAGRARVALRDVGAPVPRRSGHAAPVPPGLAALGVTSREVEVLALVAHGHTNREIAERLVISARTVDKHVERLLLKAQTDRAGLAMLARDCGLLSP